MGSFDLFRLLCGDVGAGTRRRHNRLEVSQCEGLFRGLVQDMVPAKTKEVLNSDTARLGVLEVFTPVRDVNKQQLDEGYKSISFMGKEPIFV